MKPGIAYICAGALIFVAFVLAMNAGMQRYQPMGPGMVLDRLWGDIIVCGGTHAGAIECRKIANVRGR